MITISKSVRLIDGTLVATVSTSKFSSSDLELIEQFGDPTINLGGTIVRDGTEDVLADLPETVTQIRAASPFIRHFSIVDFPTPADAEELAVTWMATVVSRIKNAVTALRTMPRDVVGETSETF